MSDTIDMHGYTYAIGCEGDAEDEILFTDELSKVLSVLDTYGDSMETVRVYVEDGPTREGSPKGIAMSLRHEHYGFAVRVKESHLNGLDAAIKELDRIQHVQDEINRLFPRGSRWPDEDTIAAFEDLLSAKLNSSRMDIVVFSRWLMDSMIAV